MGSGDVQNQMGLFAPAHPRAELIQPGVAGEYGPYLGSARSNEAYHSMVSTGLPRLTMTEGDDGGKWSLVNRIGSR